MLDIANTFKKIETLSDIERLEVGMSLYNLYLKGQYTNEQNLRRNHPDELKIKCIHPDYIVLVNLNRHLGVSSLAKEFTRLIEDDKWWFEIKSA